MPPSRIKVTDPAVLDTVMGTLPVGLMLTQAENLEVIAINEPACQFFRRPRGALERKPIADIIRNLKLISPRGEVADLPQLPIARACASGEVVKGEQWSLEHEDGQRTVVLVNAAPIYDAEGRILGGVVCWTDITNLKAVEQGLRECVATEAILLRESNHRIKNHLQMLGGLVQAEALRPGTTAGQLATSMEQRLLALAAAHEGFYSSRNPGSVNAASLLEWVVHPLDTPQHPIVTRSPPDLDFDDLQVTPVALAINEGISNALKHAFPDSQSGRISVSVEREAGMILLEISDEGKGLPEQGIERGLGTQILGALARQLSGRFTLKNRPGGGAVVQLQFPEAKS